MTGRWRNISHGRKARRPFPLPVLEINPDHALIAKLAERAGKGEDMGEAARLLLDQAVILEGEVPGDATGFAERVSKLMQQVYG